MQGADLHVRELKILSKRYERVLLVLQGVIVRRYEVSAGHGLIAGRGDRTDPRLAPAVGRGHLVGPGGVAWRYGDCRINDPVTRVLP